MPLTEYCPISSVPVTMSDRASTEKSFNDLQTAYRSELLPTVVDNWGELLRTGRRYVLHVQLLLWNAVHCGHGRPIQRLFDSIFETTHQVSGTTTVNTFTEPTEVGCIRFIRTHRNTFEKTRESKFRHSLQFSLFPRQKGIQRVLLLQFKDNKFFIDGGRVFFIIPYIIELVTNRLGVAT